MFGPMRELVESGGYFALAALMFLENAVPPLPSEFIMPLAGYVASQGKMSIVLAILAGTLGSVLGSLPFYYAGRALGLERLKRWAEKYGRWLTVSPDDLEKSQRWFQSHGTKAVLIGRLVPGVRSLIAVPAGVNNMPLPQFLIYTALGSGAWAAILALLGMWMGEKFSSIERVLNPVSWAILGLIVAAWLYRVVKGTGGQATASPASS